MAATIRTDGQARLRSASFCESYHLGQATTKPWRSRAVRTCLEAEFQYE